MKNFLYRYAAVSAGVWATIIFLLCATPGEYIPSNNWLDLLSMDKLVHATIFFVLVMLLALALIKHGHSKKTFLVFMILSIVYGISLELMQAAFFRNRSEDWKDMIANSVGCLVAAGFYEKLLRWYLRQNFI